MQGVLGGLKLKGTETTVVPFKVEELITTKVVDEVSLDQILKVQAQERDGESSRGGCLGGKQRRSNDYRGTNPQATY